MSSPVSQSTIKATLYKCSLQLHSMNDARRTLKQKYSTIGPDEAALRGLVKKGDEISKQLGSIASKTNQFPALKKDYALIKGALNTQKEKIAKFAQEAGIVFPSSSAAPTASQLKSKIEKLKKEFEQLTLLGSETLKKGDFKKGFECHIQASGLFEKNKRIVELAMGPQHAGFLKEIQQLKGLFKSSSAAFESKNFLKGMELLQKAMTKKKECFAKFSAISSPNSAEKSRAEPTPPTEEEKKILKAKFPEVTKILEEIAKMDSCSRGGSASKKSREILAHFNKIISLTEKHLDRCQKLDPNTSGLREKNVNGIKKLKKVSAAASKAIDSGKHSEAFKELDVNRISEIFRELLEGTRELVRRSVRSKPKGSSVAQPNSKLETGIQSLLQKAVQAFEAGNKKEGMECIRKLESKKPAIAGKIYGKVWSLEGEALVKKNKKLAHPDFAKVAFFGLEGRSVSTQTRIKAVKAVLQAG